MYFSIKFRLFNHSVLPSWEINTVKSELPRQILILFGGNWESISFATFPSLRYFCVGLNELSFYTLILLFLSSYLFFWDKIERSHYWLNNIVTTAKQGEELDGRLVSFLLKVRTTYLFFYRVLGIFIRIPWKIYLMHETRVCSIFAFLFLWDTKVEPTIV